MVALEWSDPQSARSKAYCRFCEKRTSQSPFFSVRNGSDLDRWCRCECGVLNSVDLLTAPDYYTTEGETSFYMRLDQADSADGVIGPATRYSSGESLPFLDVGCGLGFAADYMKWKGEKAQGIDPSESAQLAARFLSMPVNEVGVDIDDFRGTGDNFVFLSEVIEHVDSPRALLDSLAAVAGRGGFLLVTTPDADFVTPHNEQAKVLAAIGSGQHLCLVGEPGLRQMLEQAGFAGVETWVGSGRLFAVAGHGTIPRASVFDRDLYRNYLQERLNRRFASKTQDSDLVVRAFGSRLFKEFINSGKYKAAEPVVEELESVFRRLDLDLNDPSALLESYWARIDDDLGIPNPRLAPMSLPMFCYLRAIQIANLQPSSSAIDEYLETAVGLSLLYAGGSVWRAVDLEVASLSDVVARARRDLGLEVGDAGRLGRARLAVRRLSRQVRGNLLS